MNEAIAKYLKDNYGNDVVATDFEKENLGFDILANYKNLYLFVEHKSRFFKTGISDGYLKEYDILIELIQSLPKLQKLPPVISNGNINKFINSHETNTSVGWFYKCIADRLIFFRFLDDSLFDVIDIDFKYFKQWLMNNIAVFKLQYSDKTTGTINLKVPLKEIPKPFFKYTKRCGH